MAAAKQYTPIPGPPGLPIIGNIYDVDPQLPIRSLELIADKYGPIFQFSTFGKKRVFISSHQLVDEVCDEERFSKVVSAGLREIRNGVHDGLFTADYPGEENWALAHRILVPAFGPLSIRGMFDEMYDIASQLVLKWARRGPKKPIMVTDDFTRLTLDTIALCAMDTRFNSYYQENMHPFVDAMIGLLSGSGARANRPALVNNLPTSQNAKYWNDIDLLKKVAKEVVEERRRNPEDKKDLLNAMVKGKDPKTGQGLSDESIMNNMITFLIAGHETTSGMLSFLFYNLLKTPRAYKRAQEEIDTVIGRNKITLEHIANLPYITAVMRETLRLTPTAPAIAVHPHPEKNKEHPVTLGGGKYALEENQPLVLLLGKMHRDPEVYGSDADEFKPERMLEEEFQKLPKNAWKPFGNGMRGCIGRPFAWQEVLIVVAMLLQNFNFQMDDPSYTLQIKQTLTIKPKDFHMKATLREGITATNIDGLLNSSGVAAAKKGPIAATQDPSRGISGSVSNETKGKPMHILYGSNTGTCEAFAGRLATDAINHGYTATVESLDSATEKVPKKDPIVFISASYEGQPPDNAAHFFEWLKALKQNEMEGCNYAVFGCGHHDWAATFQRIPKEISRLVKERGGTEICDRGQADAAASDMFTDFDTWGDAKFWPAMQKMFGGEKPDDKPTSRTSLQVSITTGTRANNLGHQLQEGLVLQNRLLTGPGVPAKRLINFKLPTDMNYNCGDYLAVLPINPSKVVRSAMRRFSLPWDAQLLIQNPGGATTTLPANVPISAFDVLSAYVELSQPASKRDILALAEAAAPDPDVSAELKFLASSPKRFNAEVTAKRVSPLDLLLRYAAIDLPLAEYLAMLPPMRLRQYSISSSPLADPSKCSITFSVLDAPSLISSSNHHHQDVHTGGDEEDRYLGVASTYLSSLSLRDRVQLAVRTSHTGFAPPKDVDKTPMIMACAGSGIAPFRGFVMERAEKVKARASKGDIAKAILYVGCRTKDKDDVHKDELQKWQDEGVVDVRWTYSRPASEDGKKGEHVQDCMWTERAELVSLFEAGAKVYVCGSMDVGAGVRDVCKRIFLEERERRVKARGGLERSGQGDGEERREEEVAEKWFGELRAKERYATDVFT